MLQVAQRVSLQALLDKPVEFVKASAPFGQSIAREITIDRSDVAKIDKPVKRIAGDALAEPKKHLFPTNALAQSWSKVMQAPPGLHNTGNTCFLNSVMQALMHIPGLVTFLQSAQHSQDCRLNNCVFCKLEDHVKKAYPSNGTRRGHAFRPSYTQNIKQIGKQFRNGRQEDAHEFLLLLLDQLQQNSLQGQPKNLDLRTKETTVIHRLFGGHLRQQIICAGCKAPSNTYEATLVLSIDCLGTVEQGLSRLTTAENLVGRNRYKCEKCKKLQEARKQTTIYNAPDNMIIHLKRFQYATKSSKITRPVSYDEILDISRFMAPGRPTARYTLAGVVVHQGSGVSSGHYTAFGKGSNSLWHEFNDEIVSQAGSERVKKQQAYMLFYTLKDRSAPDQIKSNGKDVLEQASQSPSRVGSSMNGDLETAKKGAEASFDQLTGGNFKKRKHSVNGQSSSDHKKKRIFAQMKNRHGR